MASGSTFPAKKRIYYKTFACALTASNYYQGDSDPEYYNGRYWRITSGFNVVTPEGYTPVLCGFYSGNTQITVLQVNVTGRFHAARVGENSGTGTAVIQVMFVPNEMIG